MYAEVEESDTLRKAISKGWQMKLDISIHFQALKTNHALNIGIDVFCILKKNKSTDAKCVSRFHYQISDNEVKSPFVNN